MQELEKVYPDMIDDLTTLHHVDIHTNEFELMLQFYTQERENLNLIQGELGNVGMLLNSEINKIYPDIPFEAIEDFIEIKNMERLEFFLEEMDSVMHADYNALIETEEFDYVMEDAITIIIKKYNYFLIAYKEALLKAQFNIFNKMINNIDKKNDYIMKEDEAFNSSKFNNLVVEYEKIKCLELKKLHLKKLPIFD